MRIQHNISAMNSYRNFTANNSALNRNLEKLSTGYKINRAGDDAAGLAISEKMRAQISGLEGATKNAKDGISLIQTAEGALTEVHSMLNRMTTLAEQSANGTYQDELDREQLQKEVSALKEEIDRIADSTNFNGLKLLDGSLTESKQAVEIAAGTSINSKENDIDMTDGVTINAPTDGVGGKQTYSMEFKAGTLFGEDDKLTFNFKNNETSAVKPYEVSYKATSPANHNEFNGYTLEDQLNHIADALNFKDTTDTTNDPDKNGAAYLNGYTASVQMSEDGTSGKLILTANDENAPKFEVDGVSVDDKQAVSKSTSVAATTGAATAQTAGEMKLLGGHASSFYVNEGDTLTFKFNINGQDMYAQVKEGENFFLESSDTVADKTSKITEALKNAHFMDIKKAGQQIVGPVNGGAEVTAAATDVTTTTDESLLKVGDYFTFVANKNAANNADAVGSIHFEQNTTNYSSAAGTGAYVKVTGAWLENSNGSAKALDTTAGTGALAQTGGTAPTEGVGATNSVDIAKDSTDAASTQNFSVGEKFRVAGKLKDGREFEIELTAVKNGTAADKLGTNQFAIGNNQANSAGAIVAALTNEKNTVTVTNADGSTSTIKASDLFSDDATADFLVEVDGTTTTQINIKSNVNAAAKVGLAAQIDATKTGVVAGDKISTELNEVQKGADMAKSENLITFDANQIEQGTTMEIDGKTYEFVSDAAYTTHEDNVAVVVDNLGNGATDEEIANALVKSMSNDAENPGTYTAAAGNDYDLTVSGNKLTISSADTGADVKALDVKMGANKATTVLNVATTDAGTVENPDKVELNVKAGDTVKIGSQTYEFTEGSKGATNADHVAVSLTGDDGNLMTRAEDVAQRLADVVNEKAGAGSDTEAGIVARADGGKVVLTGKYDALAAKNGTDPYAAPNIAFANGTRKLKLQIGDTGDEYNQLTVEVKDMHAAALGIGDVDVSTQSGATAALDKIKAAVNSVSDVRGTLGALQNRLDHTINNLGVMRENIQNAESQIRDTDVAEEMMAYTKNNILNQSAQAMLAQANQLPQGVLQLLG